MCFSQKVGDVYNFKVRLALYIEVANYPLLQLGVSRFPNDPEMIRAVNQIMAEIPSGISSGTTYPYCNGSGEYTVPEDLQFDYAEALSFVDPSNYVEAGVITWDRTTYYESTLYYIPVADPVTEVPESVENHDKVITGEGTYFTPIKSLWTDDELRVAERHSTFNYTIAWCDFAFMYEGCDLDPSTHIWTGYDQVFPFATRPYVQYNGAKDIASCLSDNNGYTLAYKSLGALFYAYVIAYDAGALPIIYYPRGGTPEYLGDGLAARFGLTLIGNTNISSVTQWVPEAIFTNA